MKAIKNDLFKGKVTYKLTDGKCMKENEKW